MREIQAAAIEQAVYDLILEASYNIGPDVCEAVRRYRDAEPSPTGRAVLHQLLENYQIASAERVAICQDTGMCVIFLDIGQDAHICGGDLTDTLNSAVRRAYADGYLRKSVVRDPLYDRVNTRDNTPAVVHTRIVPGDKLDILITCASSRPQPLPTGHRGRRHRRHHGASRPAGQAHDSACAGYGQSRSALCRSGG